VTLSTLRTRTAETLLPFLVGGILWEGGCRFFDVSPQILPPPSLIAAQAVELWAKGALRQHILASLFRLLLGYVLAVTAGIILGALIALKSDIRRMSSLTLSLLISIPTITWVPVLLITMGLGDRTVITAVFLGGLFEMIYSTALGVENVNRRIVDAARIMGAKRTDLFFRVMLPASLSFVIPALRLCIGYCWRALIGAEILSAMIRWGLGKMIFEARFWNDVTVMFIGLLSIGLLAVLFDRVFLRRLERITIEKWGIAARIDA